MKKLNKKGFTIVELVIVIAVIAILAAVLIPTFSNVIAKANQSAALQGAKNANTDYLASLDYTTVKVEDQDYYVLVNGYAFQVVDGSFQATALTAAPAASPEYKVMVVTNGNWAAPAAGTLALSNGSFTFTAKTVE